MNKQPYIIGITGGSASGKSSFARELKSLFSDEQMTVLGVDNYYLPIEQVPVDANGVQNFDAPESIDHDSFINDVRRLKSGVAVQRAEYIFRRVGVMSELLTFQPTPLIVLEGIFSLHFDEVRDLVDLKLYIDADERARLERRTRRDIAERGLDLADVEYRWTNHISPVYKQAHHEYKSCADLIILNNTSYTRGLEIVAAYLREVLGRGDA